jgi:hypothetical protein
VGSPRCMKHTEAHIPSCSGVGWRESCLAGPHHALPPQAVDQRCRVWGELVCYISAGAPYMPSGLGVRRTSSGVTQMVLTAHTLADCTTTCAAVLCAVLCGTCWEGTCTPMADSVVGLKGRVMAMRPSCQHAKNTNEPLYS